VLAEYTGRHRAASSAHHLGYFGLDAGADAKTGKSTHQSP